MNNEINIQNRMIIDIEKQEQKEQDVIEKHLPSGTYHPKDASKFKKIEQFNSLENMYKFIHPFRFQYFSYVVQTVKAPNSEDMFFIFQQNMKKLLLIAKPVSNVIGPKYLISQPNSEKVEAVIRGNLLKNCFSIYDDGFNPKKNLCPKRKELGNIIFEKNSFFSEKPYSIKLIIPRPGDGIEVGMNKLFEVKGIEQRKEGGNELMEMEEKNLREIMVIKSKNPTYNKEKRIYELNFKGYIEEASFINCILNVQSGQQCLIMGKRSKETYSLFVGTPLSLIQAFGFVIGNISNKG